jgi:hypothetical protein
MGSTLLGLVWLVSTVLCMAIATKAGTPWSTSVLAGVLLGPIGLAIVVVGQLRKKAAAERERSRRPTLDSSGPTLDSSGPSVS